MKTHHRLALAALMSLGLVSAPAPFSLRNQASAQSIPAEPDAERRTRYTASAQTGPFAVGFHIYGDGSDYQNWVTVWVNGVLVPQAGNWTLSSVSGSLASIPRPITNATITFSAAQTGTVDIVGARRPRRTSQFQEGQPVPARALNQVFTDIVMQNREQWDRSNDLNGRQLLAAPGNTVKTLPPAANCVNSFFTFDVTGTQPVCLSHGVLPVASGGTGMSTFAAGLPLIGSGGVIAQGSRSGNTTTFATTSGSPINGHYAAFDGSGNVVDGGGPCCAAGTVASGVAGQIAYWAANGAGVAATNNAPITVNFDGKANITAPHVSAANGLSYAAVSGADSTAAIQAAFDSLTGFNRQVYCPAGIYKTKMPIFQDPPGNLRGADGTHGQGWVIGGNYGQFASVNYNGVPYYSLQNGNSGHQPDTSPTWWLPLAAYNAGTAYSAGDIVVHSTVTGVPPIPWIALDTTTGNEPTPYSTHWQVKTMLPVQFSQGYSFVGDEGLGSSSGGCIIDALIGRTTLWWVGPGNNQELANFRLTGCFTPTGLNCIIGLQPYLGLQHPDSVGISIAGSGFNGGSGSGGAQFTLIRNVMVSNTYTCYETGTNADVLGAENTFFKTECTDAYKGVRIKASQNDATSIYEMHSEAINGVDASDAPGVVVIGGNWSSGPGAAGTFTLTALTNFAATPDGGTGVNTYTFDATFTSPDSFITSCFTYGHTNGDCYYNAWTMRLPGFGVVPLTMTAYNVLSNTATFQTDVTWGGTHFFLQNALTQTDFEAEVLALASVSGATRVKTFSGTHLIIDSVHIENNNSCTTFLDVGSSVSEGSVHVRGARWNVDPGMTPYPGPNRDCQAAFPFINMQANSVPAIIESSIFNQGDHGTPLYDSPVIINCGWNSGRLYFRGNNRMLVNPTMQQAWAGVGGVFSGNQQRTYTAGRGCGDFDVSPFHPYQNSAARTAMLSGFGGAPMIGWHFANWVVPRITQATLNDLQSIGTNLLGNYTPLSGRSIYTVLDQFGSTSAQIVQSKHSLWSWGQTLNSTQMGGTTALSWKGQSFVVLADEDTLGWVFPGLGVYLNNGAGDVLYEVIGVQPNISLDGGTHAGYFTVLAATSDTETNPLLTGTKTTTYTATSMNSEAYNWTTISAPTGGLNQLIAAAKGVNFNATGDTALPIITPTGIAGFRPTSVNVIGTSGTFGTPSTAQAGLYTAASQGGVALMNQTTFTIATTAANTAQNLAAPSLTITSLILTPSGLPTPNTLYWNVGTPQGAAAVADVYVFGNALPTLH